MVYQDKNEEVNKKILKQYKIRAFPTFVILDSEGNELGRPRVPRDLEGAKEWFPKVADAYKNLETYEKAYKEKPDDVDAAKKMAEIYSVIGKGDKAVEIFEKLAESVKEDDEGYTDLQLEYAKALMSTMNRSNQKEVLGKVAEVNGKVLPALIEAKDERAVEAGILNARIKVGITEDGKGAVELMTKLEAAFGDGDRGNEVKYWAAVVTIQGGDDDGGKAKLEALVKDGDAEDEWVKNASKYLERINNKGDGKKSNR
ncbi:MAG: tetratricopeptide repeat protein [Planctomycetes bacterium]|nr:tetratricopeptide repeat protein [Planctomycetota bacterium]